MSRFMAIDYGDKKIGVALTDPLKVFAYPFTTIHHQSKSQVIKELIDVVASQQVERIILGLPLSIDGKDTAKTQDVRAFYQLLRAQIKLPIEWWDERYSTSDANDLLKEKKINWKDSKKIIDQIAAAVILKNYLGSKST